jgi:hypothetical protein
VAGVVCLGAGSRYSLSALCHTESSYGHSIKRRASNLEVSLRIVSNGHELAPPAVLVRVLHVFKRARAGFRG